MSNLDRYGENEIEESFGAVFAPLASMNYLSSYRIVSFRDEETNETMVRVEVSGMCDTPSIEGYRDNPKFASLNVPMIGDGKELCLVLKDTVFVNDREYYAIYAEGDVPVPVHPLEDDGEKDGSISLT